MKILIINPNSTNSMTQKIGLAAKKVAGTSTKIIATNPTTTPKSIEGYYDEALSLQGLLKIIKTQKNYDAIIIACFDDTGLDAARCLTTAPVIGIGEAAFHYAAMIANKFSVVTTLARSVPAIEHNLARYGLAARCAKVHSSEVPVLDLEKKGAKGKQAQNKISKTIEAAKKQDKAEAIVLGCAGMADLANSLTKKHKLPVLDGVACAVALAQSMVKLKLETSKLGGYAFPRDK